MKKVYLISCVVASLMFSACGSGGGTDVKPEEITVTSEDDDLDVGGTTTTDSTATQEAPADSAATASTEGGN